MFSLNTVTTLERVAKPYGWRIVLWFIHVPPELWECHSDPDLDTFASSPNFSNSVHFSRSVVSNSLRPHESQRSRHYFANRGPSGQGYGFSGGHVWMWELDCEESWAPKNWCFWIVVLEKTLESPLDCKETPVHPEGDQSWVFIGRTDAEAEIPNTLATSCKELTHWKRPWCWEGSGVGGEGDDRGWDGWMASATRWAWVSNCGVTVLGYKCY